MIGKSIRNFFLFFFYFFPDEKINKKENSRRPSRFLIHTFQQLEAATPLSSPKNSNEARKQQLSLFFYFLVTGCPSVDFSFCGTPVFS